MVAVSDIAAAKADCIAKINEMIMPPAASDDRHRCRSYEAGGRDHELKKMREKIRVQDYVAALNSAAMQNVLAVINGAATDMNTVAQNMKTVAQILANLAAFLGAAGAVLPVLRGEA